jgi:hypothetical protein
VLHRTLAVFHPKALFYKGYRGVKTPSEATLFLLIKSYIVLPSKPPLKMFFKYSNFFATYLIRKNTLHYISPLKFKKCGINSKNIFKNLKKLTIILPNRLVFLPNNSLLYPEWFSNTRKHPTGLILKYY